MSPIWDPDLPFEPHKLARADDPATSKATAHAAGSLREHHHATIVSWLSQLPDSQGRTKDDIAAGTNLDAVAVARRMRELARAGLVEEAGTGHTPAGRPALLWRSRLPGRPGARSAPPEPQPLPGAPPGPKVQHTRSQALLWDDTPEPGADWD